MIDLLDKTLTKLLDDSRAPADLLAAEVNFDVPKEGYAPEKDTLNLYLYDVHENRGLRDPAPIIELIDGEYKKRRPPIRVDCSYMLTAWSAQSGDNASAKEHLLLSQTLLWLSRFPSIPVDYLPAEWKDNTRPDFQPFPVRMVVAEMNGVKEPGEFWSALGSPPRPSVNVVVTIAMNIAERKDLGVPVAERVIRTGQRQEKTQALKAGTKEEAIITS